MDNYELFKKDFIINYLSQHPEVSEEQLTNVLHMLDIVAQKYDINKQSTDLILQDEEGDWAIVKMFIAAKAIEKKSDGTLKLYTLILNNFLTDIKKPFNIITTNDIRVYLYNYQQNKQVKNVTIDLIRRILNSFYTWCCIENIMTNNPVKNIKPIKSDAAIRKPLEPLELEYMRLACKNYREKAMVDFLYSTGCRVSEVCNAKLKDIDWDKKTLIIRNGKGGKSRYTYLNAECEVSLRYYLQYRKSNSEYIFAPARQCNSDHIKPRAIQNMIKKIAERAGLSDHDITPHTFRHTTATRALHNGMPIEQVQRLLGHSQIQTTLVYAEVNDDQVRENHIKCML